MCPDAAARLAGVTVPAAARATVTRGLAALQDQITQANRRLAAALAGQGDPGAVNTATRDIITALTTQRQATLSSLETAVARPGLLTGLAQCSLSAGAGTAASPGDGRRAGDLATAGATPLTPAPLTPAPLTPTPLTPAPLTPTAAPTGPGTGVLPGQIQCPDVRAELASVTVPARARTAVNRSLAQLDAQITQAQQRLDAATRTGATGQAATESAVLAQLARQRTTTLAQITTALTNSGVAAPDFAGQEQCVIA